MISDDKKREYVGPSAEILDQIVSPIGISIGVLWITFLIWFASVIVGGGPGTAGPVAERRSTNLKVPPPRNTKPQIDVNKSPEWASFKSLFNYNLRDTSKKFFGKLPRRFWNFYIEAMLIPSYRPEWGKYKVWSFRSPDREISAEERLAKQIRRQSRKQQERAKLAPVPTDHDHAGCTRIKFNVNGRIFETQLRTLERFPDTLLGNPARRAKYYDHLTDAYFFDRMPSSFEAILYFFQSGGFLRRPENIHLDIFYDDADFFGLPQSVINNFKIEEGVGETTTDVNDMPKNLLQRKIWLLFDYPESSIQARILAICSVFVIVLSIVIFCVETMPEFQVRQQINLVNGVAVMSKQHEILDLTDPFFFTETMCSIWFSLEYLVRFSICPHKFTFIKSWQNVIDLVSIVPYFFAVGTMSSPKSGGTTSGNISFLRVVRLVRVFRIFKLSRHSRGLKILGLTLKSSMSELFLLIFFVFLGVIIFSSCLYFAEQNDPESDFKSIPHGFWYAVITMTTVGYGETIPITTWGKIVGSLCAITGVLTIALPVPVIVSNFNYFYHQSIDEQEFNFAKLNHVENCPYRPAAGDVDEEERLREVKNREREMKEEERKQGLGTR